MKNVVDVVQHLHSALETNLEFPRLESMNVVKRIIKGWPLLV